MTRYTELQTLRSQGYEEARRLGYTKIDLKAVEDEIAKLDAVPLTADELLIFDIIRP